MTQNGEENFAFYWFAPDPLLRIWNCRSCRCRLVPELPTGRDAEPLRSGVDCGKGCRDALVSGLHSATKRSEEGYPHTSRHVPVCVEIQQWVGYRHRHAIEQASRPDGVEGGNRRKI